MCEVVTADTHRTLEDNRITWVIPEVHESLKRGDAIESRPRITICMERKCGDEGMTYTVVTVWPMKAAPSVESRAIAMACGTADILRLRAQAQASGGSKSELEETVGDKRRVDELDARAVERGERHERDLQRSLG